jgi:hypothetical protein
MTLPPRSIPSRPAILPAGPPALGALIGLQLLEAASNAPGPVVQRPEFSADVADTLVAAPEGTCRCRRSEHRRRPACAPAPSNACAPVSARASRPSESLCHPKQCVSHRLISLIVFQNGHISGALAELIRSTRAPIKDRLIGKIMAGIRCFAARACRSTGSPSWCPRACARARVAGGEVFGPWPRLACR